MRKRVSTRSGCWVGFGIRRSSRTKIQTTRLSWPTIAESPLLLPTLSPLSSLYSPESEAVLLQLQSDSVAEVGRNAGTDACARAAAAPRYRSNDASLCHCIACLG